MRAPAPGPAAAHSQPRGLDGCPATPGRTRVTDFPQGLYPMGTNDRGEFTDASGKLYHQVATGYHDQNIGDYAVHEGAWLNCDGCNPVVVVQADDKGTGGLPGT